MGPAVKRIQVGFFLVCLSLLWNLPVLSWDPTALPPGFTVADPGTPVELEGKELFRMRVNFKGKNAQEIARIISARILKLAQDPLFNPQTITVRDSELGSDIMVGDQILYPMWAFEAKVVGKPVDVLARAYAAKIRQAITAYQEEHSLTNLLIGIAKTVFAFLVLVALILLINRGMRRVNRAIAASHRIKAIKIGGFEFFTAERIKGVFVSIAKILRFLFILIFFYIYLHLGLSFFPATQRFALELYHSLLEAIGIMGEAIWRQIPALAFLVVLVFITRYVLRTLRFFFEQVSSGKVRVSGLDAELAPITFRIIRILIIAFVAVIAYPYIPGSNSPAFKGVTIFIGVLFSLGSSSAIANLIAGVSLTYTRSFRIGDVIKVGEVQGVVLERRLYITRIKTPKNQIVTIPNNTILSGHIINLSQEVREGEGIILHTSITIGYDAPWETVHALLIEAANKTKHLLKNPPAYVLQTALNDFYVTYELNAYTDAPEIMLRIKSELHQNIQNTFNEAGVEIMSPHYSQIRDGNHSTIPADYLPPDYEAPAIRIATAETKGEKKNQ
jgi:small-conductance mechanosensitive channel